MKYFFILIVFWKITLTSYSQNLEISNSTLHKLFDKEAGLLYLFSSDSLITIDLANLIIKDKQVLETVSFELVDFVPLLIKEHFYFVEKQGGQVFELKGTKIERIDKSFSHKMQVYSSIFPIPHIQYSNYIFVFHSLTANKFCCAKEHYFLPFDY